MGHIRRHCYGMFQRRDLVRQSVRTDYLNRHPVKDIGQYLNELV
ncbi:hypothetical protein APT_01871 [Acetobacter pasteurianus NBRC 101655]|nr:hypothetical protein APT_01871 [Acetobacter pasteurianus NBRC 101655]